MERIFISYVTLFFFLFLISGCSIEKRRYMSGYHVEWHDSHHQQSKPLAESGPQAEFPSPDLVCELNDDEVESNRIPVAKQKDLDQRNETHSSEKGEKKKNAYLKKEEITSCYHSTTADPAPEQIVKNGAADAGLGLSKIALISTLGWVLLLLGNPYIAVGAIVVLLIGSLCAYAAVVLSLYALIRGKIDPATDYGKEKAKEALLNFILYMALSMVASLLFMALYLLGVVPFSLPV